MTPPLSFLPISELKHSNLNFQSVVTGKKIRHHKDKAPDGSVHQRLGLDFKELITVSYINIH